MIQLKIYSPSDIDENLEAEWVSEDIEIDEWLRYLKSLTYVKDAEWNTDGPWDSYTLITFESEAHKTWFVLRWS
jgi:hypothetical protein